MFDSDLRGLLEADEILKSLTNVGEKLDEIEVNTFKENMNINEVGLFDYNGIRHRKMICSHLNYLFSRILSQIHSTTRN